MLNLLGRRGTIENAAPEATASPATGAVAATGSDPADGVAEPANRRVVVTMSAPGAYPPPDPLTPFAFPVP